jgi:hypothetical protein
MTGLPGNPSQATFSLGVIVQNVHLPKEIGIGVKLKHQAKMCKPVVYAVQAGLLQAKMGFNSMQLSDEGILFYFVSCQWSN